MASPKEGPFRELMKDILVQKDELETQLQTAMEFAQTKDDLTKLTITLKKMMKMFDDLKSETERRLGLLTGSPTVANNTTKEPLSAPAPAKQNVAPQTEAATSRPAEAVNPTARRSTEQMGRSDSEENFQNVARTATTRPYLEYSKFRKNPNIPDSQRVYLGFLDPATTEERIYNTFSKMGYEVADVKVFNGSPTNGVVGFSSVAAVQRLLHWQKMNIDGYNVTLKQYISKEDRMYNNQQAGYYCSAYQGSKVPRANVNRGGRFQVFCGGIPTRGTIDDVIRALEEFGRVRDIRMPSQIAPYGALLHRNIAYVDFESADAAQAICDRHIISILEKEVECKPNTKPMEAILQQKAFAGASHSASLANMSTLSASLPRIPAGRGNSPTVKQLGAGDATAMSNGTVNDDKCIVCKKNPKDCVILWCGDTETCMQCGKKLEYCPKPGCGNAVSKIQCVAEMTSNHQ